MDINNHRIRYQHWRKILRDCLDNRDKHTAKAPQDYAEIGMWHTKAESALKMRDYHRDALEEHASRVIDQREKALNRKLTEEEALEIEASIIYGDKVNGVE